MEDVAQEFKPPKGRTSLEERQAHWDAASAQQDRLFALEREVGKVALELKQFKRLMEGEISETEYDAHAKPSLQVERMVGHRKPKNSFAPKEAASAVLKNLANEGWVGEMAAKSSLLHDVESDLERHVDFLSLEARETMESVIKREASAFWTHEAVTALGVEEEATGVSARFERTLQHKVHHALTQRHSDEFSLTSLERGIWDKIVGGVKKAVERVATGIEKAVTLIKDECTKLIEKAGEFWEDWKCTLCKASLTVLEVIIKGVYNILMVTTGAGAVVKAAEMALKLTLKAMLSEVLAAAMETALVSFCGAQDWLEAVAGKVAEHFGWEKDQTNTCFNSICVTFIQSFIERFLSGSGLFEIFVGFLVGELKAAVCDFPLADRDSDEYNTGCALSMVDCLKVLDKGSAAGSAGYKSLTTGSFGGSTVKIDNTDVGVPPAVSKRGMDRHCYVDEYGQHWAPWNVDVNSAPVAKQDFAGPALSQHMCRDDKDCLKGRTCKDVTTLYNGMDTGGFYTQGHTPESNHENMLFYKEKFDYAKEHTGTHIKVCTGQTTCCAPNKFAPHELACHMWNHEVSCLCRPMHPEQYSLLLHSQKASDDVKAMVQDAEDADAIEGFVHIV